EGCRQRKHRINQQQCDERNPPPHPVAAHPKENRPEKHSQESGSHKKAELFQGKKSGLLQRRPDVGHHKNVIDVEEIAQRNQRDKPPVKFPQGQPLHPRPNRRVNVRADRNAHKYRSPPRSMPTSPVPQPQAPPVPQNTLSLIPPTPAHTLPKPHRESVGQFASRPQNSAPRTRILP